MIKNISYACSLILLLSSCSEQPVREYQIIPHPQEIAYNSGYLNLNNSVTIAADADIFAEAGYLSESLRNEKQIPVTIADPKDSKADIRIKINPALSNTSSKQSQGGQYNINVTNKCIEVEAASKEGAFYAVQTLRQMMQPTEKGFSIQKGSVSDYPAFSWRSFMLDEARHFKGKEVVKQLLDNMAQLKMNKFHWHLTDDQGWRVEIKKYPLLTEVGAFRDSTEINHFHSNVYDGQSHSGFYTQEDIKEIVAYAAERHIEVIPEIEMPGHASAAIAAYPWLGVKNEKIKVPCYFGVHYNLYDVSNPKVHTFINDVLDEVIAMFPSSVIHIGGDEVRYNHWNDSPKVQKYMKDKGLTTPAELQVHFTNDMSRLIGSKNRRMMGWNEITGEKLHDYQAENGGGNTMGQELEPGTIVQFWTGNPALIETTARKGYDVVNSFHEYTYLDYSYDNIPLDKAYGFSPVPADFPEELKERIIGMGCQMWGEFIPNVAKMNYQIYPRLAAYAESAWTQTENKDFERFKNTLNQFLDNNSATFPVTD